MEMMKWTGAALALCSAALACWLFLKARRLDSANSALQDLERLNEQVKSHLREIRAQQHVILSLLYRTLNEAENDAATRNQIAFELKNVGLDLPQLAHANDDLPLGKNYDQKFLARACRDGLDIVDRQAAEYTEQIKESEAIIADQKGAVDHQFSLNFRLALGAQIIGMVAIIIQAFWN